MICCVASEICIYFIKYKFLQELQVDHGREPSLRKTVSSIIAVCSIQQTMICSLPGSHAMIYSFSVSRDKTTMYRK